MTLSILEDQIALPFNPKSEVYEALTCKINSVIADYLLKYHNFDNRKMSKTHAKKISNNINQQGWLLDGQPVTFNKEGNLTEAQHRLNAISKQDPDKWFTVIVVTGVEANCFSKCALAKPRKPIDEIHRVDESATPENVAVMKDLLKRRRGEELTINNAIQQWEYWKSYIIESDKIVSSFFDSCTDWSGSRKTIGAWATLCVNNGLRDVAEVLMEYFEDTVLKNGSVPLLQDLVEFWEGEGKAAYMSNEGRLTMMYQLLCVTTDRLLDKEDGQVQLSVSTAHLNHTSLKKRGVYNRFLAKI